MVFIEVFKKGKMMKEIFFKTLQKYTNIKFDIYGMKNNNLFGQIIILKLFQMLKWA